MAVTEAGPHTRTGGETEECLPYFGSRVSIHPDVVGRDAYIGPGPPGVLLTLFFNIGSPSPPSHWLVSDRRIGFP